MPGEIIEDARRVMIFREHEMGQRWQRNDFSDECHACSFLAALRALAASQDPADAAAADASGDSGASVAAAANESIQFLPLAVEIKDEIIHQLLQS